MAVMNMIEAINSGLETMMERDDNVVIDRKSTRQNSSHANIPYAVFCLKKKKKISTETHDIDYADTGAGSSRELSPRTS